MQDKLRRLVIVYFDLMALMVTSTFAYHHTIKKSLEVVPSDTIRFLLAMFISCLFCVVYFAHKGHYSARVPLWQQVRHIIRACGMMLLADLLLNYVAFPTVHGKKWIIISWVMSFQSILLARWVARHFLKKLQLWDVPAVLVGGVNNVSETLFALKSEGYLSYDIKNICLLKSSKTEIEAFREVHPEVEISGQLTDVNPEYLTILCPEDFDPLFQREVIEKIKLAGGRYAISPPTSGASLYGLEPHYYFGYRIVLLESKTPLLTFGGRLTKSALDKTLAFCALIVLLPVFLVLILIVRRDGGPAFYGQKRVGQDGREFKCWKFRSMIPNADIALKEHLEKFPEAREEYARDFKLKDDPRITRIGNVLRRSSIDELPQLYNVLKGEMSLVGPRPIVLAETEFYKDKLKYYLAVKPGITGLWQVSGRNDISYAQRIALDAWYVENWSVWNDLVIIMKTIYVVLVRKGAY